jgi:hypothetical protein
MWREVPPSESMSVAWTSRSGARNETISIAFEERSDGRDKINFCRAGRIGLLRSHPTQESRNAIKL